MSSPAHGPQQGPPVDRSPDPKLTATIPLANGRGEVLVDAEDVPKLSAYSWHRSTRNRRCTYALTTTRVNGRWRTVQMHRLLVNCPEGLQVDHINHDGLDNRKANLRICTNSENHRNQRRRRGDASQFKGVSKTASRRWRSRVIHNGEHVHLGYFDNEIDAALRYDEAARELHGEFAYLNFPEGHPVPDRSGTLTLPFDSENGGAA